MSAALGVYIAFSALAFGVNVPPLPPVHVPVVALPLTVPARAMVEPEHTEDAAVAVTTGVVFTVTVTVDVFTPQFPSVAVTVTVMFPVVVGVNTGARLLALLNVPPVELHCTVGFVQVPFSVAARLTVPPWQIVAAVVAAALTVGLLIVTVRVSVIAPHGPSGSPEVSTNVTTVPLAAFTGAL
jgi:hypothetical protein